MIKKIDSKTYASFLRQNGSSKKQVSINEKGIHWGYYKDNLLVGVISTLEYKNIARIKGFLVENNYKNKGIGTALVEHVLRNDKNMSVFATKGSKNIFKKQGFEEVSKKPNDITFMKRDKQITTSNKKDIDKHLVPLAKIILSINDELEMKETINYICKQIQKLK